MFNTGFARKEANLEMASYVYDFLLATAERVAARSA